MAIEDHHPMASSTNFLTINEWEWKKVEILGYKTLHSIELI